MEEERNKYLEEYYKNEYDANRQMSFANAFAGFALFVVWILFLTKVFPLHQNFYILVSIILPIDVIILITPLFYLKTTRIRKPGFKYFLIFSFLMVISIINILIPKHGIIGWAVVLALTNHYYNPKLGKIVFGFVLVALLVCMYLGMFFGEYDPNLVSDGILRGEIVYEVVDGNYVLPDSPLERYEFLHKLLMAGENRYLKVFLFYYSARALFLTFVFFIGNSLNKRTYNLLVSEIKVNSEQEKMNTELEVAKQIQLATLPNNLINSDEIEIVGELKAAKEVGGDFYDYFDIDEHHIAIVIGDVSGKGVPAAMFMMKTITCFKNFVRPNKTPSQIMKEVNASIYEGNDSQMFVTCFLAILDKRDGKLLFANAGHNPPIIGTNHNYHYLKCAPGFILGGLKNTLVKDEEIILKPGESITLYTDGITEARDIDGNFFGEDRLIEVFNKKDYSCLIELHHGIKDQVFSFVNKAPQSDDITFVTLKYLSDKYFYIENRFDARMENIPAMLDNIADFCMKYKIQDSFKNNLLVVGDEIFSNIVKYGYKNEGGEIFVRLLFNIDKNEFVITIIDLAPAFNPLEVNNSMIEGDIKGREVGGLGILIVKKIMTECAYDNINGKNILVLRKKF